MIRKALKKDAKEIVYINIMSWKGTYKGILPQDFLDNLNPDNEENIKRCQQNIEEYAVYEENDKVVGIVRYGENKKGYDKTYGEIYALYVDSKYQHQNIGAKLVDYALNELKEKYQYVLISTLKDNTANKFYQKIGGELIGESEFIINNNKYPENVYRYKSRK